MYTNSSGTSTAGNVNRPLNRMKDPYADSLLFGHDNVVPSTLASTTNSYQVNSSLGLSPIKANNNQPSNKKPATPSFERSFEGDLSQHSIHHHHNFNQSQNTTRRTAFEINMKGRKQPPLSSSIFSDLNSVDFPSTSSSSAIRGPAAATPGGQSPGFPLKAGLTPAMATATPSESELNKSAIRSAHPYLSLANISPAMDRLETIWSSWIIVYGYDPRVIQLHDILFHFQQYGEILKNFASQQNWILLKYNSPVEAERAIVQPCFVLPNHQTLLAVHRMNCQLAKSLQIQVTGDDTIIMAGDSQPVAPEVLNKSTSSQLEELSPFLSPHNGNGLKLRHGKSTSDKTSRGGVSSSNEEPDIYIKPKRRKNICEKILDYFWSSS